MSEERGAMQLSPGTPCQKCGKGTGREVVLERVTSYLVLTEVQPVRGWWCAGCARAAALRELLWSAALGWWGIPLGFLAGRAMWRNLRAMSGHGEAPAPVVATMGVLAAAIPIVTVVFLWGVIGLLSSEPAQEEEQAALSDEYLRVLARAQAAHQAGRMSEALAALEEAQELYAGDHVLYWHKAQVLHNLGRTRESYEAIKRANYFFSQEKKGVFVPYYLYLAQVAAELGDVEMAERIYSELAKRDLPDGGIYVEYAQLLAARDRPDDGIGVLSSALAKDFLSAEAKYSLRRELLRLQIQTARLDDAQKTCDALLPSSPSSPEGWNAEPRDLGLWLELALARGRLREARETFSGMAETLAKEIDELAAKRTPESRPGRDEAIRRGQYGFVASECASLAGGVEEEKSWLERGLALSEGRSPHCRKGLALLSGRLGELSTAIAGVEALLDPERIDPSLEIVRADLLGLAGRADEARTALDRLDESFPARGDVQAKRVWAAALSRDEKRVEETLGEAREALAGNARSLRQLAWVESLLHLDRGDSLEAARRYQEIARSAPRYERTSATALYRAARCHIEAGRPGEADWSFLEREGEPWMEGQAYRELVAEARLWRGIATWMAGGDPLGEWNSLASLSPGDYYRAGWAAVLSARLLAGRIDGSEYAAATKGADFGLADDVQFIRGVALERANRLAEAKASYEDLLARPGLADMPRHSARRRLEEISRR
ncbi:MAG: hypothetical protein HY720_29950 [Planctomycetes bacterium]|nr:hypothetical protein [Planctomycetota bacterium]